MSWRKRVAGNGERGIPKPATFVDVRKLLEDKSIDAISIATPNHWHTLMGIWACQAGKDVYVEKPCSHNLWEGKQFVAAAQTIRPHGPAWHANPLRHGGARGHPEAPRRADRRHLHGSRALLQVAQHHRPCTRAAGSGGSELRSLDGPGAPARFHSQSFSLQLALVLGLRKRRYGKSRHPSDGCRAVGVGGGISQQGERHGRPLYVR